MKTNKKRYIAIISKTDATGGGASRVAAQLTKQLNILPNIEAHHWVGLPGANSEWFTRKLYGGRWLSLFQGVFAVSSRTIGFPDFFTPELLIHFLKKQVNYDIYHFHDISGTFSPIALNWLASRKPVVWSFHDCSPLTGGCINPLTCKAIYTKCNKCPQLQDAPLATKIDFTGFMQTYKKNFLGKNKLITITPSKWLADETLKVIKNINPPKIIPNSVDLNIFKPLNHNLVREVLNLPKERFIVLLSSSYLDSPYKGISYAIEALKCLKKQAFLIVVGTATHKNIETLLDGFEYQVTGYIYNDQLLAQYYAAGDVFLYPTLADSFGCVVLETMACGTPCVAFSTGGVPEIIDHDVTGWLVPPKDVQGLVEGLNIAMTQAERLKAWSVAGLEKVKTHFTPKQFLEAHLALYESKLCQKIIH